MASLCEGFSFLREHLANGEFGDVHKVEVGCVPPGLTGFICSCCYRCSIDGGQVVEGLKTCILGVVLHDVLCLGIVLLNLHSSASA